ncbi:MAG: hypothetical protein WB542_15695, partial [Polaromonas sp.]
ILPTASRHLQTFDWREIAHAFRLQILCICRANPSCLTGRGRRDQTPSSLDDNAAESSAAC